MTPFSRSTTAAPARGRRTALVLAALLVAACTEGGTGPVVPARLAFSTVDLELGVERSGVVEISNVGGSAVGPVTFEAGPVRDGGGASIPGARLVTQPAEVPTLNPGDGRTVTVRVVVDATLAPGRYDASLTARGGADARVLLPVRFEVAAEAAGAGVTLTGAPDSVRTGDVVALAVEVRDSAGALLEGAPVAWEVTPGGTGLLTAGGRFVAYKPGIVTLTARAGGASARAVVTVVPRGLSGSFDVVGEALDRERFTSDLWLHGDYAYTGSWSVRVGSGGAVNPGNRLTAWDVRDPALPRRVATVQVDARTVNDVKVRADGRLGVITHEGSADGLNGVTFLDLSDPSAPRVVSRYTRGLQPGVHNAWLEGDYAYLVVDGVGSGLRILDVSDPSAPVEVASYYAGSSFLHDVYVRDGLAFLSHWDAGLVILDVGNGAAGGSPADPVEVSRLPDLGGETHNAWYWPEAGYVFTGEEDFSTPGVMHVVDVRNLAEPREVATFRVPGQAPHNFWLDEERAVLYLAWYGQGVRALDVSGDLLGELDRQGREIAALRYHGGSGGCDLPSTATCTWAPQFHRGLVWVSDMNQGLVALRPPG